MINVGSVGQPRDGEPRACYVVLEEQKLMFRRVEYDIETTVAKIRRIEKLGNSFGDRLREGCQCRTARIPRLLLCLKIGVLMT